MAMKIRLGGSQPLSRRVIASYTFDYAVIVILVVASILLDRIEPFHQQFSLRNYTLQYSYAVHERVPNYLLCIVAIVAPVAILAAWTLVVDGIFSHNVNGRKRKYTIKERLWELNAALLGLGLAVSLQYVIVSTLKNAIGKPRPDLIDRCQPKPGSEDPLPFGLSNYSICTQTDHSILKDGFRSFPSGHSATSFGGLFYLSLYLSAKLHIFDSRGEVWKVFVTLIPTLGAAIVAGTRIMDARHHPFDVLSGSTIGLLVAILAYRQYFPSPRDYRKKGRAYPIRAWTPNQSLGERGNTDEEEGAGAEVEEAGRSRTFRYSASQQEDTYDSNDIPHPESRGIGGASGNFLRDEIARSQRQRQKTAAPHVSSGEDSSFSKIPTTVITSAGTSSREASVVAKRPIGSRQLSWENVSVPTTDDENGRGKQRPIELQNPRMPAASLPHAQGEQGLYDPYPLESDTSYKGAMTEKDMSN